MDICGISYNSSTISSTNQICSGCPLSACQKITPSDSLFYMCQSLLHLLHVCVVCVRPCVLRPCCYSSSSSSSCDFQKPSSFRSSSSSLRTKIIPKPDALSFIYVQARKFSLKYTIFLHDSKEKHERYQNDNKFTTIH